MSTTEGPGQDPAQGATQGPAQGPPQGAPQGPPGPGWWQASDGNWYPPEAAPGNAPAPGAMPPGPPSYAPMPGMPPGGAPVQGNALAVTALVLGIVGLVFCWVPFLGVLLGVLALIFGIIGARRGRVRASRRGQAMAGWIMGSITIVLGIILTVVILNAANHVSTSRIETAIRDYYTNVRHEQTSSVSCPRDLDKKAGVSEVCTVTLSDGTTQTVTFTITSISDNTFFYTIAVG
jgi:hypothetical protein